MPFAAMMHLAGGLCLNALLTLKVDNYHILRYLNFHLFLSKTREHLIQVFKRISVTLSIVTDIEMHT
jgi:hypothetical protein